MHKQVDALMKKEMSRKEFLATVGVGVASIFGFSLILKLLGSQHHGSSTMGYGASAYGGNKKLA